MITISLHVNTLLLLSDIFKTWKFSTEPIKTLLKNLIRICPAQSQLLRAEGRTGCWTDVTKLIVAIRNLKNAPVTSFFPSVCTLQRIWFLCLWVPATVRNRKHTQLFMRLLRGPDFKKPTFIGKFLSTRNTKFH
jgi:hypothetical protein